MACICVRLWLANSRALFSRNAHGPIAGLQNYKERSHMINKTTYSHRTFGLYGEISNHCLVTSLLVEIILDEIESTKRTKCCNSIMKKKSLHRSVTWNERFRVDKPNSLIQFHCECGPVVINFTDIRNLVLKLSKYVFLLIEQLFRRCLYVSLRPGFDPCGSSTKCDRNNFI